jgi:hypothetical protein
MDTNAQIEALKRNLSVLRERMYQYKLILDNYRDQLDDIAERARELGAEDLVKKAHTTERWVSEMIMTSNRALSMYGREARKHPMRRSPSLPPLSPIPEIIPRSQSGPPFMSLSQHKL